MAAKVFVKGNNIRVTWKSGRSETQIIGISERTHFNHITVADKRIKSIQQSKLTEGKFTGYFKKGGSARVEVEEI